MLKVQHRERDEILGRRKSGSSIVHKVCIFFKMDPPKAKLGFDRCGCGRWGASMEQGESGALTMAIIVRHDNDSRNGRVIGDNG